MSKFARKCVEDLLDDVEKGNVVMISWCINDVLRFPYQGVSWSEVSYYTDEVISERNK